MSFKLDLPAPRVPMFAGNGTMNPVWYRFFTGVSKRLGVSTTDLIESAKAEAEQAVSVAQQAAELAAEAVQTGDNVSELVNDAGYLTSVLWGDIGGTLADQTDLQTALDAKEDAFSKNTAFNKNFGTIAGTVVEGSQLANYQLLSEKGQPNGYAELDGTGKIPAGKLPSYVDDVEEYADLASFPVTGETGKIYIDLAEGDIYRWTGSAYAKINDAVSQADQALKWSAPITLTLSNKATGNVSFDGSGNITLSVTGLSETYSTATELLTAIKTVDGDDSGLDADLLGGVDNEDFYHKGNIIGTVSESLGVPTGAVIERGSNTNGQYTKFADGTLECFMEYDGSADITLTSNVSTGYFRSASIPVSYPVSFIATPKVVAMNHWKGSGYRMDLIVCDTNVTDSSSARMIWASPESLTSQNVSAIIKAKGRWY